VNNAKESNGNSSGSALQPESDLEAVIAQREKRKNLLDLSSEMIANCFTKQMYEIFNLLNPIEFMTKIGWANSNSKNNNIDQLITRFNNISYWVATEIVSRKDLQEQKLVLEKIIRVAKRLEALNNFDSLLAVLSGLSNPAVFRLTQLWNEISDRSLKDFKSLEELMSPANNFKNYNEELMSRKPPILPYLGLFLRDFTFLGENEPFLQDGNLDIELLKSMWKRVLFMQTFQNSSYKVQVSVNLYFTYFELIFVPATVYRLHQRFVHSGRRRNPL
jgi:hypothetical protein